jgi:hypothetical protein
MLLRVLMVLALPTPLVCLPSAGAFSRGSFDAFSCAKTHDGSII